MNTPTNTPTDAQRAEELAAIEAERAEKIQTFQQMLAFKLARGVRAEAEFAESVSENGLLWALEWSGRSTALTAAETKLWREVEVAYANATSAEDKNRWLAAALDAIEEVRAEVERQLLRNYVRQVSSNEFSTAVSGARAEGYARFYEESKALLRALRKND